MYHLAKSLYLHATSKEGKLNTNHLTMLALRAQTTDISRCQNTPSCFLDSTMQAKLHCSSRSRACTTRITTHD